jgi:hypothetical protein
MSDYQLPKESLELLQWNKVQFTQVIVIIIIVVVDDISGK